MSPGDDSPYARVRKRSSEEGVFSPTVTSSPSCSDRTPSASSDSGLSVASQRAGSIATGNFRRGAGPDDRTQARKLVFGVDLELAQPPLEVMTELPASDGGEGEIAGDESGLGHTFNGEASSSERETDILDDEDEIDDSEAAPALENSGSTRVCTLSSENLPEAQEFAQSEYSTHSWVQQQQLADAIPHSYSPVDGEDRLNGGQCTPQKPSSLVAPITPSRGSSSREAVQRGLVDEDGTHVTQNTHITHDIHSTHTTHASCLPVKPCQEEDLASLTTDIDESIEQLNQLILDLDPTFIPVPTRCAPLSRSASLFTNGLSHKGNTHLSGKTRPHNRQQINVSFNRMKI